MILVGAHKLDSQTSSHSVSTASVGNRVGVGVGLGHLVAIVAAIASVTPGVAKGQVIFSAPYDTGDFGGWPSLQMTDSTCDSNSDGVADRSANGTTYNVGRGVFYTAWNDGTSRHQWSNSCSGSYATDTESANITRTEVYWDDNWHQQEGQTIWYRWKTKFDSFPDVPASGWRIFTQFKDNTGKPPPVALDVKDVSGDKIVIDLPDYSNSETQCSAGCGNRMCGGEYCLNDDSTGAPDREVAALTTGVWNEFALRVLWNSTSSGKIDSWHRTGANAFTALAPISGRNMRQSSDQLYVKQGLYRGGTNVDSVDRVVTHDDFVVGTFCRDVAIVGQPASWCNISDTVWSGLDEIIPFTGCSQTTGQGCDDSDFVCVGGTCATSITVPAGGGTYDISFGTWKLWYPTGVTTMAVDVRIKVNGTTVGAVERRGQSAAGNVVRQVALAQGTHTIEAQARSVLVNGPPMTVRLRGNFTQLCTNAANADPKCWGPVRLAATNTW